MKSILNLPKKIGINISLFKVLMTLFLQVTDLKSKIRLID